jgi:hypothetical protein
VSDRNAGASESHPKKDPKTLAKEARAWVASPQGQEVIKEKLIAAQRVTQELGKSQKVEMANYRAPFDL